jgi:glycine/D-amino acid oxidase-like deaminating enzyme
VIKSLLDEARDATISADVVVVGGGPVGIVAALTLLAAGLRVLLVESGGIGPNVRLTYQLGAARITGDERFGVLEGRVMRGLGGTSWRWMVDLAGIGRGVRYAVVEPGVLARRMSDRPNWPFNTEDLMPWYRKALGHAGVVPSQQQLQMRPSPHVQGLDENTYMFGRAASTTMP